MAKLAGSDKDKSVAEPQKKGRSMAKLAGSDKVLDYS
jgi:hypothetical protein